MPRTNTPIPQIPFSQVAYDQLGKDFARLTAERKEVLVRLQAAREMGDLSENGAYTYAKLELASVSRQLRTLKHLLDNGHVAVASSSAKVSFGTTVTIKNNKGKEITYSLVSIHESDLTANKLSTESPLGAALMGKKVGDVVKVVAPAGESSYEILTIKMSSP